MLVEVVAPAWLCLKYRKVRRACHQESFREVSSQTFARTNRLLFFSLKLEGKNCPFSKDLVSVDIFWVGEDYPGFLSRGFLLWFSFISVSEKRGIVSRKEKIFICEVRETKPKKCCFFFFFFFKIFPQQP